MTDRPGYVTLVCDAVPHDLVLLDVGPAPLAVAQAYRQFSGLGLWRAQQAVTAAPPVLLAEYVPEEYAVAVATRLTAAGASATALPHGAGRGTTGVTADAPPTSRPGP
ncbi:ribosomal protein L7/L12 [Kitasatospora sp. NPDC051853]|uniref:ribosomal protein L7/L12 n=1 Tax=Kitasatospora sp. NPDC051853 TaxID=3364058 RepID=UPI0037A8FC57